MDDKTRIEYLKTAIELLLPYAEAWQQESESHVNPARSSTAANTKARIEKAKALLSGAGE